MWGPSKETEHRQELIALFAELVGARVISSGTSVLIDSFLTWAGIEGLHTEAWSDEATAFRPQITKPFPDFAELFTLVEKLGILRRARRRWGWAGVWTAVARQWEVHKLLTQERILGLDLVMGVKRVVGEMVVEGATVEASGGVEGSAGGVPEKEQVTDLPLFRDEGEGQQ